MASGKVTAGEAWSLERMLSSGYDAMDAMGFADPAADARDMETPASNLEAHG